MSFISWRKGKLIAWFIGTSYCVILDDYGSVCLLSRYGKESSLLNLLVLVNVLFNMTIVLCVFYLLEEQKADCLVYWYFVLCYFR